LTLVNVREVYKYDEWRLHLVCRKVIDPEPPGDGVAGIDLGISNIAALSFSDESILFPGNALKEDEYYFGKKKAKCDDGRSNERLRLDRKRTERRSNFLHSLSKHTVSECVERDVGTIVVGDLGSIRDDENGEPRNWGKHGTRSLPMGVRLLRVDTRLRGGSRRDRRNGRIRTRHLKDVFRLWNQGRQPARRTRVVRLRGV
jgi:transposase